MCDDRDWTAESGCTKHPDQEGGPGFTEESCPANEGGPAVYLQVMEEPARPPACTARERECFERALTELRQEFGGRLVIEYRAVPAEVVTFLPRVTVQDEVLAGLGFPSYRLLRLVVGRHLALELMVEALGLEAEAEACVRGVEADCWQDALLTLGCQGLDSG